MATVKRNKSINRKSVSPTRDEDGNEYGIPLSPSSTFSAADSIRADTPMVFNPDDAVRVVIRVRPLNELESQRLDGQAVFTTSDPSVIQTKSPDGKPVPTMRFDRVFNLETDQEAFFDECGVRKLIEKAVEGYNATVFAYGQTGSGKTHSITGPDSTNFNLSDSEQWGIVPRSLRYIFDFISQHESELEETFVIKASYLEIYNENVYDLLNPTTVLLPIRYNREQGFFVENLFTVECDVLDDCMAVLEEGLKNRRVASHRLNENSSRSHAMMQVTIERQTVDPEDRRIIKRVGKLNFVDLAGSERVKETKATGQTFTESLSINKSLLCLGNCISALADMQRKKVQVHVPYRDSKLTKLLFETLGGNGLALMIACVSPSSFNLNETLNTLRYASRARKIQNKPTLHIDPREELIMNLKKEIKQLREENEALQNMIEAQQQDPKKYKQGKNPQADQELKDAHEALTKYIEENKQLRANVEEFENVKFKLNKDNKELLEENDRLIGKIENLVHVFGAQLDNEIAKTTTSLKGLSGNQIAITVQDEDSVKKDYGMGNARLSLIAKRAAFRASMTGVDQKDEVIIPVEDENVYDKKRLLANTLSVAKKKQIDRSVSSIMIADSSDNEENRELGKIIVLDEKKESDIKDKKPNKEALMTDLKQLDDEIKQLESQQQITTQSNKKVAKNQKKQKQI